MASHQSTDQNSKAPRDSGSYLRRNSHSNDSNSMCIQRNGRADPLGSKFNVPPGRPPIHHPPSTIPTHKSMDVQMPIQPIQIYIYIYGEKSFLFRGRRHAIGLACLFSLHFRGNKSQTATNSETHWSTSSETFDSSIIYGTDFFCFFLSFSFLFFSFLPGRHN